MKKLITVFVVLLATTAIASAQYALGGGELSASFETNTISYVEDLDLTSATPDDRFGSNNYLKLDYIYGKFSAGVQIEAYLPALYGYEIGQQADPKKFWLASKYVSWTDENFYVLVGDVYDQFGNGLIFRSYEDRQLGLNNSLEGVHAKYNFSNYLTIKGMYGRPRLYTDYADSWVRGADLSLSLADIVGMRSVLLSLEGSYVNRYENSGMDYSILGLETSSLDLYSGRLNFAWNTLSLRAEYATKGLDLTSLMVSEATKGKAIYGELIYSLKGFSISGTFRTLEDMATMLTFTGSGTGNTLNYLPALTRQYTYMLANLNPYQVNTTGEIAGQLDLYYNLRSSHSRHKYWNFHVNLSTAYTLDGTQSISGERQLLWSDANIDIERQWSNKLKTTLLFSRQEWSPTMGADVETYVSNIFVADVSYKFSRKTSLRGELQYLLSDDYEGDWAAMLLELNFAPKWSIFASDMYNLGTTEKNYYNFGFSYTKNRTRIQLSYGRNRAGYICSGGVCRYSPAYTGANLTLTTSF